MWVRIKSQDSSVWEKQREVLREEYSLRLHVTPLDTKPNLVGQLCLVKKVLEKIPPIYCILPSQEYMMKCPRDYWMCLEEDFDIVEPSEDEILDWKFSWIKVY